MRVSRSLRALVTVAVLAAACSSSSDSATTGDDGDATTSTAAPAPTSTPTTAQVSPPTTAAPATTAAALPTAYLDHQSELYSGPENWLCHPRAEDDVCRRDLGATAVAADGSTTVQPHQPATDPLVDCFYVYPTVSRDQTYLSDLTPGENEEIQAVVNQAARLNQHCALYAPVYRQRTLAGIFNSYEGGEPSDDDREIPYQDVVDAFRQYIANESEGRGFILIGHSQGSGWLSRLIAEEIDGEAALRDRMISAYLLGSGVAVPTGEVVGGAFDSVPLCTSDTDTACVVSYASFRSTAPPPEDSLFGRVGEEGQQAACVNPAELTGEGPASTPYFAGPDPYAEGFSGDEITTPYVTYPDFLELRCVNDGTFSYLEVTVLGDPADNRTDDISGDLTPDWGLHLVDANVAMGDIVELAGRQIEAYTS